ncbi:hypothetical protein XAC217_830044 [Xanthomonas citri pv. citri]|nr:hypothetical protein XAC217_830044 [Xanthomonas citri pv. citri]
MTTGYLVRMLLSFSHALRVFRTAFLSPTARCPLNARTSSGGLSLHHSKSTVPSRSSMRTGKDPSALLSVSSSHILSKVLPNDDAESEESLSESLYGFLCARAASGKRVYLMSGRVMPSASDITEDTDLAISSAVLALITSFRCEPRLRACGLLEVPIFGGGLARVRVSRYSAQA